MTQTGHFLFWWGTACTNRAENKQEFSDLMQQVKEFKEDLENDNVDLDTVTVIDAYRTEGEENYLFDEVAKLIPAEKIMRMKAGCIISAHCGPGTTGLYYLKKRSE